MTDPHVIVGFDQTDDAAIVRLDGTTALVQSVDFFTPIVDDPYDFGQIAAANSLSDIYAMGGKPLFALNIIGFPIHDLPRDMLIQILQGGADKAKEAGISVVGGHTIDDKEPKYGLVVTGEIDLNQMVRNSTAKPGDVLVLTKPLGTGIISTAIKKGQAKLSLIQEATRIMTLLNEKAASLMKKHHVHAATDITGYGLLGHLLELCKSSQVSAHVEYSQVQFIEGVDALAKDDFIPGGSKRNYQFVQKNVDFTSSIEQSQKLMLSDAQTSGGLLITFDPQDADKFLVEFNRDSSPSAFIIGRITSSKKSLITVN